MFSKLRDKIYQKITEPKIVKLTATIALIVVTVSITIGIIVAVIGPPGGYNPIDNYISDLGGSPFTPFPYFLDIAAIISGIFLIPTLIYLGKILIDIPKNNEDRDKISHLKKIYGIYWIIWILVVLVIFLLIGIIFNTNPLIFEGNPRVIQLTLNDPALIFYYTIFPIILWLAGLLMLFIPIPRFNEVSRMRIRLGLVGFAWSIVGLVGWFFIGVFSEDRNILFLHFWAGILCFIGFPLAGFFYGLIIIFYDTIFPKALGIYTTFVPTIACFILIYTFEPLAEWSLLFSIFGWLIPGYMLLIRHFKTLD